MHLISFFAQSTAWALLTVSAFSKPVSCSTSDLDTEQLRHEFDRIIANDYRTNEPGGVVLVARKGDIIYQRAFGMANLELEVPMQTDMVFNIGSVTKQFTAVAILRLVAQGKLALADTVGKFLPEFPERLRGITVEQLLTHTSGVPNAKSIASLLALERGWLSAQQVTDTFKDQPLDFAPGSAFSYSNSGYQLLGYILEKVTGWPFAEYMDEHIIRPAGMINSLYGNEMKIVKHRASPYLYTRRGIENAANSNVQIAYAAGALQSTAEDLFKWYQALLSGTFIHKELQQAWTRGKLNDGSQTDYGYGWFVGVLQGSPIVEHGGNMGGFMCHAIYLPKDDVLVIALFNFRGKLPELLTTDLAAITIGKPLNIRPVTLADDLISSYQGNYADLRDVLWKVGKDNGNLFVQKTGGRKWTVFPYAKDRVYFENAATLGEFERDAAGSIVKMVMYTRTGLSRNELHKVNHQ